MGGTLTFFDGKTSLETVSLASGTAKLSVSTLKADPHSLSTQCLGKFRKKRMTPGTVYSL